MCEELRIKDACISKVPPHRRLPYSPTERLAILELRAARGWSLAQTADVFSVTLKQRFDSSRAEAIRQEMTGVFRPR